MASISPTDLFAGCELVAAAGTVAAQSLCIPLTALPGLTAAEAHPTTGDGREVARQLNVAILNAYNALGEAEKPSQMSCAVATSQLAGTVRRLTYSNSYNVSVNDNDLPLSNE